MDRNEELLLGRLAVREGLCTQADIDECLKIQNLSEPKPALGDLLVFKRFLTEPQLKMLLARQNKRVMRCPRCSLSFTVLTLSEGKSARCPRCKGPLVDVAPESTTQTDAEFATQRMRLPPTAPPSASTKTVRMECVICSEKFQGAPDSSGRVNCPSCHSSFTPRG